MELERQPPDHPTPDVLVVGAGAAGAAAFLEAAAAGASVLGIDQLDAFGGTAATSGGGCCVAGTPLQAERGIVDAPDMALRDLLEAGGGEAHEPWARYYFRHARREVYDWLVGHGVEFVDIRPQEHNCAPRWHLPRGNGSGLMDALWAATERAGLANRWRCSTRVEDLVLDDGRVVGVRVRQRDGGSAEIRAGVVVMATGGFAGDLDRVLEHVPRLRSLEHVLVGGGVGARGSGHRILAAHGGEFTHLEHVVAYAHATPDYREPAGRRGLVVRGIESAIWVNRAGRRFHDESSPGPALATPAVLAQSPPTCWAILDRPMAVAMRIADPAFRADGAAGERIDEFLRSSPFVAAGETPEALAAAAGIDAAGLAATLGDWNRLVVSGAAADPQTGRSLSGLRPYGDPPFYAVQFVPLVRKNLGGVRTDLRGRVLDRSDRPIPNLYAAGELTGFGGGHLSGRNALEGIMIGASIFGGRVAGAWAAAATGRPMPALIAADAAEAGTGVVTA